MVLCWSLLACSNAGDVAYGRGMDLYSAKRHAEAATHLEQAAQADHVLGMATLASIVAERRGRAARCDASRPVVRESGQSQQRRMSVHYRTTLFQRHWHTTRPSESAYLVKAKRQGTAISNRRGYWRIWPNVGQRGFDVWRQK